MHPIVIAHHLIWVAYGCWLPNDPRGSTSKTIRNDIIAEIGKLHFGRKRLQPASRDIRTFYAIAKQKLMHPLLEFGASEISFIAEAFQEVVTTFKYTGYACAIMRDHVHLVIRKHRHQAEEMIANFQMASRLRLRNDGLRGFDHPVWGGHGWKVFLDEPQDIWRTVEYVQGNPSKGGLPAQTYPFVSGHDNWPLHAGHDPNSPYARRLRRR